MSSSRISARLSAVDKLGLASRSAFLCSKYLALSAFLASVSLVALASLSAKSKSKSNIGCGAIATSVDSGNYPNIFTSCGVVARRQN